MFFFNNVNELFCFKRISRFVYRVVENIGVEPMTSCVQGKRSSQLS